MGVQVLDPIGAHRSLPRPALRRLELAEDVAGERPLVIVAPAYLSLLRGLLLDVECDVEIGLDGPHVLDLEPGTAAPPRTASPGGRHARH